MGKDGGSGKSAVIMEQNTDTSVAKYKGRENGYFAKYERPDESEKNKLISETKQAMEKILDGKIKAARSVNISEKNNSTTLNSEAQFIKYTPSDPLTNVTKQERIIRIVEAQVDPLEPAKFKHKKVNFD